MAKNPGPKLYFSQFGGEQPIPPEFVAAMQRSESLQAVPNDVGPEDLVGDVLESSVTTNRTNERVRKTIKKAPGNITLRNVNTNQDGQPVQTTRTLFPTGSQPDVPSATTKVAVQDLGNGWSIQESAIEGTYVGGVFVPGIFSGVKYEVSVPDVVPEEFRVAVPTTTTDQTVVGTATVPVLGTGDLDKSQEQIDSFRKRTHVATRAGLTLPIALGSKDTTPQKQLVTITETLKNTGGAAVPTATKDVKVKNLGDGTVLQTEYDVPSVFAGAEYAAVLADTIPQEFQNLVPKRTTATTAPGTATAPTLTGTVLSKRLQQVDVFNVRTEIVDRDAFGFPAVLVDKFFGGPTAQGSTFSGVATKTKTLNNNPLAVEQSFLQFDSTVRNTGAGLSIRETSALASYPDLIEFDTDGDNFSVKKTKRLVVPGSALADFTSRYALDSQRSLDVTEIYKPPTTFVYHRFPGYVDIDLPPQLLSVTGTISASLGLGSYSETGTYLLSGKGSGGIALNASARGSAAAIPDYTYVIKEPWTRNIPCTHYLFYVPDSTVSAGAFLALLKTYFGPNGTIISGGPVFNLWPLFSPKSVTLCASGERSSGEAIGNVHATDAVTSDYNGVLKLSGNARTSGSGFSEELELSVKTIRIPPTIHGAIAVVLPSVKFQTYTITGSINVTNAGLAGLGASGRADATYDTSSIPATPGQSVIPTSGVYIYKYIVEPYKNGYSKVHYITIDFANIL